jgi:hypothetical protein
MKSKIILFVVIFGIFSFNQISYSHEKHDLYSPKINSKMTPSILVSGNLISILNGDNSPSEIDNTLFSSAQVIGEIKTLPYLIVNDGTSDLTISSVVVSGPHASDFQITVFPSTTVLAGNTSFFIITFNPSVVGIRDATIEILSNDIVNPSFMFAIQGKGLNYMECGFNASDEIVAIQDFEPGANPISWGYNIASGSASVLAGTAFAENGSPVVRVNKFIGTKSLQVNNSICMISFNSFNTINIKDPSLTFKLGSYSNTTSEGSENGDFVSVAISTNGGVSWSNELEVTGSNQSKWSFNSGTGIASSTYMGADIITGFSPIGTGFVTSDGYGELRLLGLPSVPDLKVRITMVNNQNNEIWAIDNVTLYGKIQSSTIWDGTSWSNGIPNNSRKAIIDGAYNTGINGSIVTCKCQINSGKSISISANTFLSSESDIVNLGDLTVESGGILLQKDDYASNIGNTTLKREVDVRKLDYVYWSSPLEQFNIDLLSPNTPSDLLWKWNPTTPNPNGSLGFWVSASNEIMAPGKGYIVRGPSTFSTIPQTFTATFSNSKINNGVVNQTISRGNMTSASIGTFTSLNGAALSVIDDNWNLVGNPYPSAINVDSFLTYNAITNPTIEGSVRIWTHGNLPSSSVSPFYSFYQYNYTANDYITYNGTATLSGPSGFDGFIASGQGFFVLMNEGSESSASLTFDNSMRVNSLNSNIQFFKKASSIMNASEDRHRIWLDLINQSGTAVRTVVGYVPNATLQKDILYDAYTRLDGVQSFYSLINQEILCIQGRPLPFDTFDMVPMGFSISTAGNYTIAIAALDGLFEGNQNIYIMDTLLNVLHDLKQGPYHFQSNAGHFNERFVLQYNSNLLESSTVLSGNQDVNVLVHSDSIIINCNNKELIESVSLFDILGRNIFNKKAIASPSFIIENLSPTQQPLLVKINLKGKMPIVKKILY